MLIGAWLYSFIDHFMGLKESSSPAMRHVHSVDQHSYDKE